MASTTLLNIPPPPRTPTSTGPSSPPATEGSTSGPGTPASGISALSTTAIKDGHEGHRPTINFDVAAERVARLGGLGPPSVANPGYFDRERPVAYHGASSISNVSTAGSDMTPEGDVSNSTQYKRETMAAAIARRQIASGSLPANATATGNPSLLQRPPPQQQQQSTPTQGQQLQQQQVSSSQQYPLTDSSLSALAGATDSPASGATTTTTPSVAEARREAKMIDGMTYDEDVVDTTAEGIVRGEVQPATGEESDVVMKEADTTSDFEKGK